MAKLNPEELAQARANLKEESRRRVAERGLLQFRADPETVLAVLQAADAQKMPVGALLRQWIQERLRAENEPQDTIESRLKRLEEKNKWFYNTLRRFSRREQSSIYLQTPNKLNQTGS